MKRTFLDWQATTPCTEIGEAIAKEDQTQEKKVCVVVWWRNWNCLIFYWLILLRFYVLLCLMFSGCEVIIYLNIALSCIYVFSVNWRFAKFMWNSYFLCLGAVKGLVQQFDWKNEFCFPVVFRKSTMRALGFIIVPMSKSPPLVR